MNTYNFDQIFHEFFKYLTKKGVSATSLKNYKSDLKHFTNWVSKQISTLGVLAESLTDTLPFLTKELLLTYKAHLSSSGIATQTLNRRLSTLRQFSKFLLESSITSVDIGEGLKNVERETKKIPNTNHVALKLFESHLISQKVSKNTIKNYLSDINQFFSWTEGMIQETRFKKHE